MRTILASAAVAIFMGTPLSAQPLKSEGSAALRSYAQSDAPKVKSKKTTSAVARAPQRMSRYSTNPEYDVYVNGTYVGSDPDPRIRWHLKQEWKSGMGWR